MSPTAACRLAALVASAASVGALTPLCRAIATGSVLRARHAAVPLAAFGSLAGGATVGLAALLAGAMATASRRLARTRGHGTNQAMLGVADQIAAAGLFQRLAHQLVVLGLAILDERALQRLLVRTFRHEHALHGEARLLRAPQLAAAGHVEAQAFLRDDARGFLI